jgi:CO/xanthine dehydrogenase Mo-binding subunit
MTDTLIRSRREVLKAGSLVVAFSLTGGAGTALAQPQKAVVPAALAKPLMLTEVDSFLTIDADGAVTVYSGKVDLGTGVKTALTQIVADELDVPMSSVRIVQGDTLTTPDQGPTFGSVSIQIGGMQIRNAAALARAALLEAAANAPRNGELIKLASRPKA